MGGGLGHSEREWTQIRLQGEQRSRARLAEDMEEAVFGLAKLAHSFLKGAQWVATGRTSRNNRLFRFGVSH